MIGRMYMTSIGDQAQTVAKTLIEIAAAADLVVLIERMWNSQSSFDTSENGGMKVEDISIAGTLSANTPTPLQTGTGAATATVTTNASIEPTYSGTVYIQQGFNVLSGWLWTGATDDEVIVISPSQLVGMMTNVTVTSMNMSYGMTFREIGG